MNREKKGVLIEELKEKFAKTPYFYVTDTSGFTVSEINSFRRICFQNGLEYKVFKNTIIKKALDTQNVDYSSWNKKVLKGFSGIIFCNSSAKIPAKVIKEFQQKDKNKRPTFKAASIESDFFIGEENLEILLNIKSKNELVGDIVTLLQSPMKKLVTTIQSGNNTLTGVLKTLSEK
ncbi:MAG: 50S ribosomal protein L10 [Chitinophagaceae bacterium]|nr:50S ribosomal protein L10 [Chitinophagaceae bacterium]